MAKIEEVFDGMRAALVQLRNEAAHYLNTKKGEQFLRDAIAHADTVLGEDDV